MYFVYLLLCADGSLYTGITNDVAKRLAAHKAGTASRYTRSRGAVRFEYLEVKRTRSGALKREAEIKKLPREAKLALIRVARTRRTVGKSAKVR